MIQLNINGQDQLIDVEPEMPLLWVLRDGLGMTGTKFGCGIAQCGACTVHINGQPVRSCSYPVSAAVGQKIVTIEGLSTDSTHPVQEAWLNLDVPQCGYCHTRQMMSAADLLAKKKQPSSDDIKNAMSGNICRCGTYSRIEKAVKLAADKLA